MQDQTRAEEAAQEALGARRERDLERGLLAASREKPADEPGDEAQA